jgi:signal transduction histidine kinase
MGADATHVHQPTALIISDDPDFSQAVVGRWQSERSVPAFTLMGGDLCLGIGPDSFDIAVVGALHPGALPAVLAMLEAAAKPVFLVCEKSYAAQEVRETQPRVTVLRAHEGWLDALVMICAEALRARLAVVRAERAEQAGRSLERQATLGRYMLDQRHSMNNALTSVLGNSELLLLEPGLLSAATRVQIETIRNMAVRMHEILQRFSSIEKELSVLEKQAESEARSRSHAAAANL